jgi:membrane protein
MQDTQGMANRFVNFWTLGGLPLPELIRRTVRESWQDEVFGQAGRMAFYHFLALFPTLLLVMTLSARIPQLSDHVKHALRDLCSQILPGQVSALVQQMLDELTRRAGSGLELVSVLGGASWAALNATWAMIYGLNHAYEVEEHRSRRQLTITIAGLTLSLALAGSVALFLIFLSAYLRSWMNGGAVLLLILEWLILIVTVSLAFAVLYRFAPNLRDHEWRWSTPGALCALILWVGSTFVARAYFDHVNNYARSYGHLNGVVMLLLWLYVTNGAILIGGEVNSEIEKAARAGSEAPEGPGKRDRSG